LNKSSNTYQKEEVRSVNSSIASSYAKLSVISITVTAIITSVHHVYREGPGFIVPAVLIVLLPYILMRWFGGSGGNIALGVYGLLNALIIVGLGIVDGFFDHVVNAVITLYAASNGEAVDRLDRAFRVLTQTPLAGDPLYEITGILTFLASMFAAYYLYRFMRATFSARVANARDVHPALSGV